MTAAAIPDRLKPKPVSDGLPGILVDETRDLIRVLPRQFHTPEELTAQFDRLRSAIAGIRRRGRRARVIVDLRGASVLSPEGAMVVQAVNAKLYRADDRVALVIGSDLQRLQARRLFDHTDVQLFENIGEAEMWVAIPPSC